MPSPRPSLRPPRCALLHCISLILISAQGPTVGVDIYTAVLPEARAEDKTRVIASFYDLNGAQEYWKIRSEFYHDFDGAVLAFDLSNKANFAL